jgi:hypothetical protein
LRSIKLVGIFIGVINWKKIKVLHLYMIR